MSTAYRVGIVDPDPVSASLLVGGLTRVGHQVVAHGLAIKTLTERQAESDFDLIICDHNSEGSIEALSAAIDYFKNIPVIMISEGIDPDLLEKHLAHQVFGLLLKPIREDSLATTIVVAAQRFQEFNELRSQACSLRTALEHRKLIEQAKGVVMTKCGFDEVTAFRHLQHLARQHRQKLVEVARGILIAEDAFAPSAAPLRNVSDYTDGGALSQTPVEN
jgi:AmiR/NasT family two-component response regulator